MSEGANQKSAPPPLEAEAIAHSNIALAKYWGKLAGPDNMPAVPSLSLTLDGLTTRTRVRFDSGLAEDVLSLDGFSVAGRPLTRVIRLLDEVRALARLTTRAEVSSKNSFPTAAGLASSASGFAALALAAASAAGLALSTAELSSLARRASASAARSVFGGYVALRLGAASAEPLLAGDAWPLRMIVLVTKTGPKETSSTEAMLRTAQTSPYYAAWLSEAPRLFAETEAALGARDFDRLGTAMEASALMMHASMLAARPPIAYFTGVTLEAMANVKRLRSAGTPAYFTMDAGPHVKVLTTPAAATAVEAELRTIAGIEQTFVCAPGPAARVIRVGPE